MRIEEIHVKQRIRRDLGDIEELAKDIEKNGLIEPIVIDSENILLAGHRRLEACKHLGWTEIPTYLLDVAKWREWNLDDFEAEIAKLSPEDREAAWQRVRIEWAENTARNDFPLADAYRGKQVLEAFERVDAAERQREAGRQYGRGIASEKFSEAIRATRDYAAEEKGRAKTRVARAVGVSRPTLDKVGIVLEAAEQRPDLYGDLREKLETSSRGADGVFIEYRRRQVQELFSGNQVKPLGAGSTFHTIVIDPPWDVAMYSPGAVRSGSPTVAMPYPVMSDEEIERLQLTVGNGKVPMKDLIAPEGCHLFLWTTHSKLPVALRLAKAWGFQYKCILTWNKGRGMPDHGFQLTTELVVYARTPGALPLLEWGRPVYFEETPREHSRKPDAFYELVRAVGPAPRLDIFGRGGQDGFVAWGNESERFDGKEIGIESVTASK